MGIRRCGVAGRVAGYLQLEFDLPGRSAPERRRVRHPEIQLSGLEGRDVREDGEAEEGGTAAADFTEEDLRILRAMKIKIEPEE